MSHDQATEQTLKEHRDHHLMTAQRLSEGLGTPGLKVIEVTTHLKGLPSGDFTGVSGRGDYEAGHIPGAYYLDLQQDLSDTGSDFRFTVPSVAQFEAAMRQAGIGESDTVVVYAANHPMWACRVWWLFQVFGHERVLVLDGGLPAWQALDFPALRQYTSWDNFHMAAQVRQQFDKVASVRFTVPYGGVWCRWADGRRPGQCRDGQYTGLRADDIIVLDDGTTKWLASVLSVEDSPPEVAEEGETQRAAHHRQSRPSHFRRGRPAHAACRRRGPTPTSRHDRPMALESLALQRAWAALASAIHPPLPGSLAHGPGRGPPAGASHRCDAGPSLPPAAGPDPFGYDRGRN